MFHGVSGTGTTLGGAVSRNLVCANLITMLQYFSSTYVYGLTTHLNVSHHVDWDNNLRTSTLTKVKHPPKLSHPYVHEASPRD
jgi:hypothetical protein